MVEGPGVSARPRAAGPSASELQARLEAIEDRKIEILMEIAEVNREYDSRVSALDEEYYELDREHFQLRLDRIAALEASAPPEGDGEP